MVHNMKGHPDPVGERGERGTYDRLGVNGMKYVVIVNGVPLSGKTTFSQYCARHIEECEFGKCYIWSSIDRTKEIYRMLGWDGTKSDEHRGNLSSLKKMYIKLCNGPLRDAVSKVMKVDDINDHYFFMDVREVDEIAKFVSTFESIGMLGIKVTTLYMSRSSDNMKKYGNDSDDNTHNYQYNHIIYNSHDLQYLKTLAMNFVDSLAKNGGNNNV